ncbi:Hint domain-containing protein [Pseudorhodobacter sp.]|uniref:Hint domain-containing protein n=1 Tax=Pseudorhodobacter sp. TaxID=1934400 RepID=UPI002649BB90|nr:Hint domain-containing protein [Pseudorhodobacter sp.]MDN5786153.1 Hint domain-containing protein [Pseudorhodobacter sp.]
MTGWFAVSDSLPMNTDASGLLTRGHLVLEYSLPVQEPTILLAFRADDGWQRHLSIIASDEVGIVVTHRQGDRVARHILPLPPYSHQCGTARLAFAWDGPGKQWTLTLDLPNGAPGLTAMGTDPMPMLAEDIQVMCRNTALTTRHKSLLWFGFTKANAPPEAMPWIGAQTWIETTNGPQQAGRLRSGDTLLTDDGGQAALLSIRQMITPSRGSFSPVVLCAGFLGAMKDTLCAAEQLVMLSGCEVEYLFGEESVLLAARHFADGRAGRIDARRALTQCVALDIGSPQPLLSDVWRLLSHRHAVPDAISVSPYPVLKPFEAVPLLAMLRQNGHQNAA